MPKKIWRPQQFEQGKSEERKINAKNERQKILKRRKNSETERS